MQPITPCISPLFGYFVWSIHILRILSKCSRISRRLSPQFLLERGILLPLFSLPSILRFLLEIHIFILYVSNHRKQKRSTKAQTQKFIIVGSTLESQMQRLSVDDKRDTTLIPPTATPNNPVRSTQRTTSKPRSTRRTNQNYDSTRDHFPPLNPVSTTTNNNNPNPTPTPTPIILVPNPNLPSTEEKFRNTTHTNPPTQQLQQEQSRDPQQQLQYYQVPTAPFEVISIFIFVNDYIVQTLSDHYLLLCFSQPTRVDCFQSLPKIGINLRCKIIAKWAIISSNWRGKPISAIPSANSDGKKKLWISSPTSFFLLSQLSLLSFLFLSLSRIEPFCCIYISNTRITCT